MPRWGHQILSESERRTRNNEIFAWMLLGKSAPWIAKRYNLRPPTITMVVTQVYRTVGRKGGLRKGHACFYGYSGFRALQQRRGEILDALQSMSGKALS